jgi:aromatic-amino-acid transaminase
MTIERTAVMPAISAFRDVPQAPPDPILGLTEAYLADPNPAKVNLGVGVYLDEHGKVPILRCVAEAQKRWIAAEDSKGYLPIDGIKPYNRAIQELVLGEDSPAVAEGRAVTLQSLGGTGALRVGAEFLRRFLPESGVWLSTPSWENHRALFEAAGHTVSQYPYYDPGTHDLDFAAMCARLRTLAPRSTIVLHACCHNPSGVDPNRDQWLELRDIIAERSLVPFLDFAYQGLGDGLDEDAFAVRAIVEAGIPCLIANSFSKSFSLYRERVGGLTVVTASPDESARALSQLKRVVRASVSNPPSFGGQVVALTLGDPELSALWREELTAMRLRIRKMRRLFAEGLRDKGISRDFGFIERQKGMFSFLGLPVEAVHRLRKEFGIYAVDSSRVCVAAMNERNVARVCDAVACVSM